MDEILPKEYKGIKVSPYNDGYKQLAHDILGTIKELNTKDRDKHHRFYEVTYNNKIYHIPETEELNVVVNNESILLPIKEVVSNIENYSIEEDELKKYIV